jgi:hypothetical protein
MALFGHGAMSELSLLSGVKRKLDFGALRSAFDPERTSGDVERLHIYFTSAFLPDYRRMRFRLGTASVSPDSAATCGVRCKGPY